MHVGRLDAQERENRGLRWYSSDGTAFALRMVTLGSRAVARPFDASREKEAAMQNKPDVMIIDTDRSRIKSLRRMLKEAREELLIEEVSETRAVRDAILTRRPRLVLLHTTFPYIEKDGTGLLELIQEDFRNTNTGIMLVLPLSGSLLYRSGYMDGIEILDMADDLITTDFTSDMVQSLVLRYLDRKAAAEQVVVPEAEPMAAPSYVFTSKPV
jgi:PleD family two-component response regulator